MFQWRPRSRTKRLIVHSSHLPPSPGHRHYDLMVARGRVMGLLDIGYHLVIERDGEVVEGRPLECIGSHAPGCNHDSVGVCLAGGFEQQHDYTPSQLLALDLTLARLLHDYPGAAIFGHTELQRYKNRDLKCPAALDMEQVRFEVSRIVPEVIDVDRNDKHSVLAESYSEGPKLTPQNQLLVDYLKSGRTLTTLVAITSLGVFTLSKRISELKRLGYEIGETWAEDHHQRRYKKYRLEGATK